MDQDSMKVILKGIDNQIKDFERQVEELRKARKVFIEQNSDILFKDGDTNRNTTSRSTQRRLRRGLPRKWVLEVVTDNGPMTIAEMKNAILNKHEKLMADGTIRRVVENLKNEMKFHYNETEGTYKRILENNTTTVKVDDDDMPF